MKSKINHLIEEIEKKKNELKIEYHKLMWKYGFSLHKGRIIFNSERIKENRKYRISAWKSFLSLTIRHLIAIPFIYVMFIPALILDAFLFIYQQTAVRLYGIPLVKRSDYIVYERKHLDYLNWIEKFNCLYCSYFNWLMSFAVEVAWRTEKYWCPIKSATRKNWWHNWEKYFADYGDPVWFKEEFNDLKCFTNSKK